MKRHQQYNPAESVIVPVAGAFNIGPSAEAHFGLFCDDLARQTQLPVLKPIVPCAAGIVRSPEHTFQQFKHDLASRLVPFEAGGNRPNLLFVAHSLGGIMVHRWLTEPEAVEQQQNRIRAFGAVTLGSPHDGLPRWQKVVPNGRALNKFIRNIDALAEPQDGGPIFSQIASTHDHVVAAASSMAPLRESGYDGHLFHKGKAPRNIQATETYHTAIPVGHITMLIPPQPTASLAVELVRRQAHAMHIPDLLPQQLQLEPIISLPAYLPLGAPRTA